MTAQKLRQERLGLALDSIRKEYGDSAIRRLGQVDKADAIPHVSTGFTLLDNALGIGGFPKGQLSHLYGIPTSGATTIGLKTLAQAAGEAVIFASISPTFDADYAARCGVAIDDLLLITSEMTVNVINTLTSLVDTAAAAVFALDNNTAINGADVKRLITAVRRSACALLVVTHEAAGPVTKDAAVRLHVERETWVKRRQDIDGYRTQVQIVKNQFGSDGLKVRLNIGFHGVVHGDGT